MERVNSREAPDVSSYEVQPPSGPNRPKFQYAEPDSLTNSGQPHREEVRADQLVDIQVHVQEDVPMAPPQVPPKELPKGPPKGPPMGPPMGPPHGDSERSQHNRPMQKTLRNRRDSGQEGSISSSFKRWWFSGGPAGSSYSGDCHYSESNPPHRADHRSGGGPPRTQYEVRPTEAEARLYDENMKQLQTIAQLQNELRRAHETANNVKVSLDRMQLAMDNKDLFVGVQLSDDVLQRKFQSLMSQVKTWAGKFRPSGVTPAASFPDAIKAQFEAVSPGCTKSPKKALWEEGKTLRLLIRGWIGLLLSEHVFRVRAGSVRPHNRALDQWMGVTLQESVADIEDELAYAERSKISCRDLHDWRALTVELLSKVDLPKVATDEMHEFIREHTLRVMGIAKGFESENSPKELAEALHQIFENAIQLSQLLRRQRACWSVDFPVIRRSPEPGPAANAALLFKFDPSCMVDDREEEGEGEEAPARDKLVDLVITPGLFKRGNADGEGYEHQSCMTQSLVLCKPVPTWTAKD